MSSRVRLWRAERSEASNVDWDAWNRSSIQFSQSCFVFIDSIDTISSRSSSISSLCSNQRTFVQEIDMMRWCLVILQEIREGLDCGCCSLPFVALRLHWFPPVTSFRVHENGGGGLVQKWEGNAWTEQEELCNFILSSSSLALFSPILLPLGSTSSHASKLGGEEISKR